MREEGATAPIAAEPRAGSAEAHIHLERVTKAYGSVVAVDDLTLTVHRGEFFSLLGPSGCGKTTTLRLLGGFEEPDLGIVHLGGEDVTALPPYKREVNTVFQSYALFPNYDVFGNVAFGLRRQRVPKEEIRRRVGEALELVDLGDYARRRTHELSGGQQQRVALARALVNRPQLLLLDEPLGALDLKLRKQMQIELKRIQSEVGITFLYVTHDQEEALTMSDRLAVMRDGKIEQLGEPAPMYDHPETAFVAGFLGASNLLAGRVASRAGDLGEVALGDGARVRVPARSLPPADDCLVGVRPEKVTIAAAGSAPQTGWNAVEGVVRDVAFVGVGRQYTVDGPGGSTLVAYVQNVHDETIVAKGDPAQLSWRDMHTFAVPPDAAGARTHEEGSGD
jgi:spermidine/putrescine transport system ATP-binding protein